MSPFNTFNEISNSDPLELLSEIIKVLNEKKVAFLEISEEFGFDQKEGEVNQEFWSKHSVNSLRAYFKG